MNIFQYSASLDKWFKDNLKENGYEAFTTFYSDLTIAEVISGEKGIKDTYNSVVKSWLSDIKYITEFCMAINWKAWEMDMWLKKGKTTINGHDCVKLMELYTNLYYKLRDKIYDHYKNDEKACEYFYRVTD